MQENYQQTESVEFSAPIEAGDVVALPPTLPDKNKSVPCGTLLFLFL